MKVCVMSDSHGNQQRILDVLARETPDLVLHAGDHASDILDISKFEQPNVRTYVVAGNCDMPGTAAEVQIATIGTLRLLLTHGHRFDVKQGYLRLVLKAAEEASNFVVFGHTHAPTLFIEAGRLFLNPGSLSQPRGYKTPTYVMFEWVEGADETLACVIQYKSAYDGSVCTDLTRSVHWDNSQFTFI